jgi:hypothetical protein
VRADCLITILSLRARLRKRGFDCRASTPADPRRWYEHTCSAASGCADSTAASTLASGYESLMRCSQIARERIKEGPLPALDEVLAESGKDA